MTDPLKHIINRINRTNRTIEQRYIDTDYTDSYVAFLDIMGMKNLVDRKYEDLRKVFNVIEAGKELYANIRVSSGNTFIGHKQVKITIISDSIVLSIDSNIGQAFSKIIGFASYLIQNFLKTLDIPVFVRGAITKGPIFQDPNVVFGPALVDAYTLESEVASSMRCIISNVLLSDSTVIKYMEMRTNALVRDPADNIYFIKFARDDNFELLLESTTQMLNSSEKGKIKDKYAWLKSYIEREKRIHFLGSDPI